MWWCCGCFSRLRPRYKRLVDDIFPAVAEDGLVKSNMEKLLFFAVSSPEKLDRIGEYLYDKASKDISRKRYGFAKIAMEATDQLLVSCHAQALSLFLESFLRMVQKLLESSDLTLQILATESFVRFANIDEQTPSYHLRYDFFISIFSSMCHNCDNNPETQRKIRLAGIRGLQGVIRKTTSDDLVENIWHSVHMNKIIPSLLFNMQSRDPDAKSLDSTVSFDCGEPMENDPHILAEQCLRELVTHASFGHVKSVIQPILLHLDLHNLWLSDTFGVQCFKTIMYSLQPQYLYMVVESLMVHLNQNIKSSLKMRTSMADVLHNVIGIIAEQCTGPTALEIVNSLLTHIRSSAMKQESVGEHDEEEACYREILFDTLTKFTAHLPDYQKVEIMTFIMSKITLHRPDSANDITQYITLKCLLRVTTSVSMASLPYSLLLSLLEASETKDARNRLLVQKILHSLLDKHGNTSQFEKPVVDFSKLNIVYEMCGDSEANFIISNGKQIYASMYHNLEHANNTVENVDSVFTTLALLCTEFTTSRMLPEFFHFLVSAQEMVIENLLPDVIKYEVHSAIASLFSLCSYIHSLQAVRDYINEVIANRMSSKSYNLTEVARKQSKDSASKSPPSPESPDKEEEKIFFDITALTDLLQLDGITVTALPPVKLFYDKPSNVLFSRSYTDDSSAMEDVSSKSEPDSQSSSPSVPKKICLTQELTFEGLKRIVLDHPAKIREKEMNNCAEIFNNYKFMPFEELCGAITGEDDYRVSCKLHNLCDKLKSDNAAASDAGHSSNSNSPDGSFPASQMYPELFAY